MVLLSNKKVKIEFCGCLIIVNDYLFVDSILGLLGNENDYCIINCVVYL